MAIVQDEISLVKVSNGNDGKDTYIHKAYSWSADGTDRFTTKYPNENLLRNSKGDSIDGYNVWVSGGSITTDGEWINVTKAQNSKNSGIKAPSTYLEKGKHYLITLLIKVDVPMIANYCYITSNEGNIKLNNSSLIPSSEVGILVTFEVSPTHNTNYRFMFGVTGLENDKNHVYSIKKIKIEQSSEPTIYTPSPKDDYENAYPKYEGSYSSHNPVQSTNPSDYTWSVIRGENGKDGTNGTDGKDGVTPKDVISGYLSNESIIVPATPTGAVTDLSKAFGDFVVFEGQTKKTSGVTYSKVSEVGMTSTIDSNGRYVISALSADTGTATYRATYSGVTIDKIMIVVKNKQGQSGADGKDGSNGKDGATGPQGPPTGITTSATVPSNPYVNMLWQNTGANNGYITGVTYQWNGAKWNIFIFSAENIVANSLSAISANLGTITAGEILTSFFRGDSISSANKKRGTTTISDGQFKSSFDYVQVTNNTILGKGDVVLDENGFMIRDLTTSKEVLRSVAYNPEGIFMTDANENFGTVALKYKDLMTIPETLLQASQAWSIYGDSPMNKPTAKRELGKVTLSGAFRNDVKINASTVDVPMGILPQWAIPESNQSFVCQGSGVNRYFMVVRTNGTVNMARYGSASLSDVPVGSWLNISAVYSAKD